MKLEDEIRIVTINGTLLYIIAVTVPLIPYFIFQNDDFDFKNYFISIVRKSDGSRISAISYFSSIFIAPWVETFLFYALSFLYDAQKNGNGRLLFSNVITFFWAFLLHGGTVYNIGQGINFCIMLRIYQIQSKQIGRLSAYKTVSFIHAVWNIQAMGTIFIFDHYISRL